MPLFNKIGSGFASMVYGFCAGASESIRRMWVPRQSSDFHFDVSNFDQTSLRGVSRWLALNSALYSNILNLRQLLMVGYSGVPVVPASSDKKFNRLAQARWDEFCENGDVSSDKDFYHAQAVASMALDRDGEVFCILVNDGNIPKVQWIESHRLQALGSTPDGAIVVDGVEVDKYGKPIAYYFQTSNGSERFPAENVVHFYDPERFGQHRGLPICAPVVNDLLDLYMLQNFLMDKAKFESSRLAIVETPSGQRVDYTAMRNAFRQSLQNAPQDASGTPKIDKVQIKESLGAEVAYIPSGYKFTDLKNDNPSENTMAFMDSLISKICIGCDITRQFISPASISGASERVVVDINNLSMRSRGEVLYSGFRRIYKHVVRGISGRTNAADWWKCSILPPGEITADKRYEMDVLEKQFRYGFTTFEEVLAKLGRDPVTHFEKLADEYTALKKYAKTGTITEFLSRGTQNLSGNMPAESEDE